jgi:hypothetical protein
MNEDGSGSIVSQKECGSLSVEACDCTVPKDEAELGDEEAAVDDVTSPLASCAPPHTLLALMIRLRGSGCQPLLQEKGLFLNAVLLAFRTTC